MIPRKTRIVALVLAVCLSGTAQAALQGRDLDGNASTAEAYYDTDLNITWLADANYAQTSGYDTDGMMTWANARTWADVLSFTDGVNVYDNWRLPTTAPVNGTSFNYSYSNNGSTDEGFNITSSQSEMAYMFYVNLRNPGYYTPAGEVSGCYVNSSNTCLDSVGPFGNLQPYVYWSATAFAPNKSFAWAFGIRDGGQGADSRTYDGYAWAVSPGDVGVAAIPEADTWAMLLVGLGLVRVATRRRE